VTMGSMILHEGAFMTDVNTHIIEKIKKFGAEVSELAKEALRLSENLPEQSVAEQLESMVRQIIRNKGE